MHGGGCGVGTGWVRVELHDEVPRQFSGAAVIDDVSSAYAVGDKRLFVIDDGDASAIFQFVSANADAVVTVDELFLVAVVDAYNTAVTGLIASDFILG